MLFGRAIHECTRELNRTRTCEYFNSQTGTRTRANLFPRVTRTRKSSTHELQVHPPSLYQKWHINRLSDALGTFYVIYSLYIYILYAYISRELSELKEWLRYLKISVFWTLCNE